MENKKEFLKLLDLYLNDQLTEKEREMMDIWFDTIQQEPEEGQFVFSEEEIKIQMWEELASRRHQPLQVNIDRSNRRWWQFRYFHVAAAVVLFLLSFIIYRSLEQKNAELFGIPNTEMAGMVKKSNSSKIAQNFYLSDGSQITLDPGAVLYYPLKFEKDQRVVFLEGNGFFDITKNPDKPFLVYTDAILTKVLGTSFRIVSDNARGIIEVSVATGKVLVDKVANGNRSNTLKSGSGVVLTPNRKVTYQKENEKYIVGLVEKPRIIDKNDEHQKPETFIFSRAPLSLVLVKLEKAYGVPLLVNNENLKNCLLTADLSKDDLFGKLEIICAALNAKFELKEDKILIVGEGCHLNK